MTLASHNIKLLYILIEVLMKSAHKTSIRNRSSLCHMITFGANWQQTDVARDIGRHMALFDHNELITFKITVLVITVIDTLFISILTNCNFTGIFLALKVSCTITLFPFLNYSSMLIVAAGSAEVPNTNGSIYVRDTPASTSACLR